MKTTTISINGLTPLLMHSGRLADPLDKASQTLAKLAGKKNKTIDDHKAIGEAEWYGSLYLDEKGRPCLPGEVLEACLAEGAKRYKLGKVAKGGLIVEGNFALEYDGPKDPRKLWEHGGFSKRAGVRVKQNRVIRTRPMFPQWSCTFTVDWDPLLVKDEDQLIEIAKSAGLTGVGDWRPKFGRFEVRD